MSWDIDAHIELTHCFLKCIAKLPLLKWTAPGPGSWIIYNIYHKSPYTQTHMQCINTWGVFGSGHKQARCYHLHGLLKAFIFFWLWLILQKLTVWHIYTGWEIFIQHRYAPGACCTEMGYVCFIECLYLGVSGTLQLPVGQIHPRLEEEQVGAVDVWKLWILDLRNLLYHGVNPCPVED